MKEEKISLLLVSSPGVLQQTLKHIFGSKPQVTIQGVANGGLSAIKSMKNELPDGVVIDANVPETETDELIQVIRKEFPGVRSLVLVATSQQFSRAALSHADFVIRSYDLTSQLDATLAELQTVLKNDPKKLAENVISE